MGKKAELSAKDSATETLKKFLNSLYSHNYWWKNFIWSKNITRMSIASANIDLKYSSKKYLLYFI